jgi:hypothetical protein
MSTTEVISFSFCQVSDLNLDSSAALNLHLSPVQRKQRNEEALEAFASAMKMASSDDVNAVLVPGNLFDAENITTQAVARVQRIFAMLQEIPVYIAPGSLDPLFNDSLYDESALRAHGLPPWSENVHIFSSNSVQTFSLPGKSSVKVSGIGLTKEGRRNTPVIPPLAEADKVAINILLLPLGLVDAKSGVLDADLSDTINGLGYSYVALSGFKNGVALNSRDNVICAAAAGTFIGQTERELGPRHALFLNLDRRIGGGMELTIRPEEFDPRRIVSCNFDISGKEPAQLNRLMRASIEDSGARHGLDIMVLHLNGHYPSACRHELASEAAKLDFFHMKLSDETRPDYLETMSNRNMIEGQFIALMEDLRAKALAEGGLQQTEKMRVINDALYYGLEAIREGTVTIRHAD